LGEDEGLSLPRKLATNDSIQGEVLNLIERQTDTDRDNEVSPVIERFMEVSWLCGDQPVNRLHGIGFNISAMGGCYELFYSNLRE